MLGLEAAVFDLPMKPLFGVIVQTWWSSGHPRSRRVFSRGGMCAVGFDSEKFPRFSVRAAVGARGGVRVLSELSKSCILSRQKKVFPT